MKKLILPVVLLLVGLTAESQTKELILRKADGKYFLEHKVVAKENFYSIGRLYNVSAKFIAQFNDIDMNKGLNIDQQIRIPLTDTNFRMSGNSGTPVYYRAGLNTNMTRISEAYRNVPVERLQYWNRRIREEVAEGEKLIIGFLLTNGMASITLDHPPLVMKDEEDVIQPVAANLKEDDEKPTEPVKTDPVPTTSSEPPNEEKVETGYFRTAFQEQIKSNPAKKNKTVTAGIFKTSSGWSDQKYYLMVDEIPPGTIVKLINPTNNISVYAKVLGEMSGIRLNEDLDIRISNAAASVLQITETEKFIMKINY